MFSTRSWVVYGLIFAVALAACGGLLAYWYGQYQGARSRYVASAAQDTRFVGDRVEVAFTSIYQNIRTLSTLPSIRSIDRHGTTLSAEAKTTIQQIYNNLASNVSVSEVYVLPVDFDPERIDPATGHHETPILAFDQLIAPGAGSDSGPGADDDAASNIPPDQDFVGVPDDAGLPQVEIQEYRRLKQQLAWLSANYPTMDRIDGMNVPMIGSPELITCDNTVYDKTRDDTDRMGLIQLVPFYGMDGKLKGGVAAIMRSDAYRALLPDHGYALVNTAYGYATRPLGQGQEAASAAWVKAGKADPGLVYSETAPLKTADPTSSWLVWAGRPDADFFNSADVLSLRNAAIGSVLAVLALALAAAGVCFLVSRNARAAAMASSLLERRVDERTAEIRALASVAEAESAQRLQRVNETTALNDSLAQVVSAAVAGDFSRRVEVRVTDEALRGLAHNVNELMETVDRGIAETGGVLAALARTDLRPRVAGRYAGALGQLKDDTNAVADRLTEVVLQLRGAAGAVRMAMGGLLQGSSDLSERTSRQAAGIEEASASIERLEETTAVIATRADAANGRARSVAGSAAATGELMDSATAAMARISEASSKISNVVGFIDDIAFQTNLLALNASVEAARAGEAGKGFAVVAVEVRRLAQSAAEASAQVKALVQQAASEVSGGATLVDRAAQSLSSMLADVEENSTLIAGIATATGQQAATLSEIATTVRQIDQMTQHNAALVEETNATIAHTETQANSLDDLVDVFVVDPGADQPRPLRTAA